MGNWRQTGRPIAGEFSGTCIAPFNFMHLDQLMRDMGLRTTATRWLPYEFLSPSTRKIIVFYWEIPKGNTPVSGGRPPRRRHCVTEHESNRSQRSSIRQFRRPVRESTGGIRPYFRAAEATVKTYFSDIRMRPSEGTIEISGERYVLVRASAFSKDFLDSILHLYKDRSQSEAFGIGRDFLFDISHAIGINDAKAFHAKMNVTDPLSRLSAGPVHFAYTGWAFVDILPDSTPTPDDHYFLHYHHPYSFEADAWVRAGVKSEAPVCIMSAGYSTGWCQESFGLPLTAVEVSCRAKGDAQCTFVMSPPHKINEHLQRLIKEQGVPATAVSAADIPTFFLRKTIEEQLEKARVLAEESSQAKSEFVANMSHELRTPLTAILGFTELLKKTRLSTRQNEYLEAICTSGTNLLSTINDIMDLSKLDAGKVSVAAAPLNIPRCSMPSASCSILKSAVKNWNIPAPSAKLWRSRSWATACAYHRSC